jgi:hypothetical protein
MFIPNPVSYHPGSGSREQKSTVSRIRNTENKVVQGSLKQIAGSGSATRVTNTYADRKFIFKTTTIKVWKFPIRFICKKFTTYGQEHCFLTLHVNDVPNLVVLEVGGEMLHTTLLVGAREHVPRAATVALGVRHFLSARPRFFQQFVLFLNGKNAQGVNGWKAKIYKRTIFAAVEFIRSTDGGRWDWCTRSRVASPTLPFWCRTERRRPPDDDTWDRDGPQT